MSMLRMKSVLTVLTVVAIVGLVSVAHAAPIKVVAAGSSAMFQTAALGAYNSGSCVSGGTAPCFHWTSGSNKLSLQDSRPTSVGGSNNEDAATVWVVWDSSTVAGGPDVWIYAKVDSVVGDRCFFGDPPCQVVDFLNPTTFADWTAAGANQISSTLWGDGSSDTSLTAAVLAIVEKANNLPVNVAATDIRPEDAWFAIGRANSSLGANSYDAANSDGLDGLGYNANNAPGVVPSTSTSSCTKITLAKGVGTPIMSAFQNTGTTTDAANVLAFNLSGFDPFSCTKLPTYTVASVGAEPVVFVHGQQNNLAGLQNATEAQLQQVFSGTNTDASAFGLSAASINAYLREATSGTMNTTEATVFRYPTLYSSVAGVGKPVEGLSQETGVGVPTPGSASNPLQLKSAGTGLGFRWRGIGTSEVVNSVLCSTDSAGSKCNGKTANSNNVDGIAYTFFSYGNVKVLADNTKFAYITLDGVDPIFQSFDQAMDPGQPAAANGAIPGSTETTFPACENKIWKGGLSFPNVRIGAYRAWNILRLAYSSTVATPVSNLIKASNTYAVTTVPDYIPLAAVTIAAGGACGSAKFVDPGFVLGRSHYQQLDGSDALLGKAPVDTGSSEAGGDMGGKILLNVSSAPATETQGVQSSNSHNYSPALRPAK